ncbi:hypothetical protein RhiirA4_429510 [Rhizophagus irregularis]|uniref:Uncharacterized protein n=1 Tax=Rhizophagus irregularis TaxID=588596 RepID=A0A2I1HH15_9GLOM|nr:hypothetical protein RhiirA4_429510 [Rhizophagus irregularis]
MLKLRSVKTVRPNERNEELVALLEIDENELDYTSLNNLMKINVNNPGIIDPISADFDEIIERLSKLEQKLSIEQELHFYVTGLQRLKFLFKNIGISISDSKCYEAFTLGKLFTAEGQSGKKYLLTVNHGVREDTPRCATVTKYKDLVIVETPMPIQSEKLQVVTRTH